VLAVLGLPTLAGCAEQQPALERPTGVATSPAPAGDAAAPASTDDLPEGGLRSLVPAPDEVPPGLLLLPATSGPRDAEAVAAFSADPAEAAAALGANGFTDAYVAQYASPQDSRALSVVVVRFASADGARADYEGDVASGAGEPVDAAPVGDASEVRRVELSPEAPDVLITVRLRSGATTWLLAWRAPRPGEAETPLALARSLAARG
jgi:hypothetical protein